MKPKKSSPNNKVYTKVVNVDFKTKSGKSVSFKATTTSLKPVKDTRNITSQKKPERTRRKD